MIGLRYAWSGEPLAEPLAHRFSAALGMGRQSLTYRNVEGASLAGRGAARRGSGNPLLAQLPNGDVVLFHGHIDNRAELRRSFSTVTKQRNATRNSMRPVTPSLQNPAILKIIGQYAAIVWSPRMKRVRLARSPIQAPALHYWYDRID